MEGISEWGITRLPENRVRGYLKTYEDVPLKTLRSKYVQELSGSLRWTRLRRWLGHAGGKHNRKLDSKGLRLPTPINTSCILKHFVEWRLVEPQFKLIVEATHKVSEAFYRLYIDYFWTE